MHLFYNPYSIVNELCGRADQRWTQSLASIAPTARRAASRLALSLRELSQPEGDGSYFGPDGGADRARTDDPLLAKQVLSQLS